MFGCLAFECAVDRLPESFFIKWLEHIVDRVLLKSLDCVLIVSCRENNVRLMIDLFEHVKAVHAGHLDIQEDQVWFKLVDLFNGLVALGAFADHFNFREADEVFSQQVAGQFLIINDQAGGIHIR